MYVIANEQQIYRVKYLPEPPPGNLDLNCSDEEFSPDKLRSNLERFYVTVVCYFALLSLNQKYLIVYQLVSFVASGKHVARLRSWRETRRTAWFCTVGLSLHILAHLLLEADDIIGLFCSLDLRSAYSNITGNSDVPYLVSTFPPYHVSARANCTCWR